MRSRRTALRLAGLGPLAMPHLANAQVRTKLEAIHWWVTAFEQGRCFGVRRGDRRQAVDGDRQRRGPCPLGGSRTQC